MRPVFGRGAPRTPGQLDELGAKPLPLRGYKKELRRFYDKFLSTLSNWRSAAQLQDPRARERQSDRFKAELSVFDALFQQHGPVCRELAFNITSTLAKRKDVPMLTMLAICANSILGDSALSELRKMNFSRQRKVSDAARAGLEEVAIAGPKGREQQAVEALMNDYDVQSLYEIALLLDQSPDKDALFTSIVAKMAALNQYERDGKPMESEQLLKDLRLSPVLSAERREIVALKLEEMAGQASDLSALPGDYEGDGQGGRA
jgi:hypothetical protein